MGRFFSSIFNWKVASEFIAAFVATETSNPYYFYPTFKGRGYKVTVEKYPTP